MRKRKLWRDRKSERMRKSVKDREEKEWKNDVRDREEKLWFSPILVSLTHPSFRPQRSEHDREHPQHERGQDTQGVCVCVCLCVWWEAISCTQGRGRAWLRMCLIEKQTRNYLGNLSLFDSQTQNHTHSLFFSLSLSHTQHHEFKHRHSLSLLLVIL